MAKVKEVTRLVKLRVRRKGRHAKNKRPVNQSFFTQGACRG